jgi:hypothetical protein
MTLPRRVGSLSAVSERATFLAELPEVRETLPLGSPMLASSLAGAGAMSAGYVSAGVASVSQRTPAEYTPPIREKIDTPLQSRQRRETSHRQHSKGPQNRQCPCQMSLWRRVFSQAQAGLAPIAGVLVVFVLLSSAGLLFMLITDSRRVDSDVDSLSSWEEGLRVQAESPAVEEPLPEVAPLKEQATAEVEAKVAPADVSGTAPEPQTTEAAGPTAPVAAAEPMPTYAVAEESVDLGSLGFPQTSTPAELDYEQAQGMLAKEQGPALQALPSVAERDTPAADSTLSR